MIKNTLKSQKKISFANDVLFLNEQKQRKWSDNIKNQKKGRFSQFQMKNLIKSLAKQAENQGLQISDLQSFIQKNNSKIWSKVCNILPNRSLVSCFKHLKRKFNFCKTGKWENDEISQLKQLVDKYGKKWKFISNYLGRSPENIRDKYRNIGQQNYAKINKKFWRIQELIVLLKSIQQQLNTNLIDKRVQQLLLNAQYHNGIEQKQMLSKKYNTKDNYFHNIKVILPHLNDKPIRLIDNSLINWKQLGFKIPSKTSACCRQKCFQILKICQNRQFNSNAKNIQIINFLLLKRPPYQDKIDWNQLNNDLLLPKQAENRFKMMKCQIKNRNDKDLSQIIQELKNKYCKQEYSAEEQVIL